MIKVFDCSHHSEVVRNEMRTASAKWDYRLVISCNLNGSGHILGSNLSSRMSALNCRFCIKVHNRKVLPLYLIRVFSTYSPPPPNFLVLLRHYEIHHCHRCPHRRRCCFCTACYRNQRATLGARPAPSATRASCNGRRW